MSLINFNFLFAVISGKDCGQNFIAASQAMVRSPSTSPTVKQLFNGFQQAIQQFKPCIMNGDVACLAYGFESAGVRGMQQGVSASSGMLQQLFLSMMRKDQQTVTELRQLKPSDGAKAVKIANATFCDKASWILQYLKFIGQ